MIVGGREAREEERGEIEWKIMDIRLIIRHFQRSGINFLS